MITATKRYDEIEIKTTSTRESLGIAEAQNLVCELEEAISELLNSNATVTGSEKPEKGLDYGQG